MARISKQRGYGLERKLVLWFGNETRRSDWPLGWEAERNTLSKEQSSFGTTTAKHDVKARKVVDDGMIYLQIEAKKTGKPFHTIEWKWINKIDFSKDELLVIAMGRTTEYAFIDIDAYSKMPNAKHTVTFVDYAGDACFRLHSSEIENALYGLPYGIRLTEKNRNFVVFPLEQYVKVREQMPPTFNKEQTVAILGQETARQAIKNEQPQSPPTDIPAKVVDKPSQVQISLFCPHCNKPIKLSIDH
jgi:hypothetical protein